MHACSFSASCLEGCLSHSCFRSLHTSMQKLSMHFSAMGNFLPSLPGRKCSRLCLRKEILSPKLVLTYPHTKVSRLAKITSIQVQIPYDCFQRAFYSRVLLLCRQSSLKLLVSPRLSKSCNQASSHKCM